MYYTRLKDARIKRGLSQRELAKLANIHCSTVSLLEHPTQRKGIHITTACALARVLDMDVYDLFDRQDISDGRGRSAGQKNDQPLRHARTQDAPRPNVDTSRSSTDTEVRQCEEHFIQLAFGSNKCGSCD